ncbi:Hypothetical protein DHA2_151221 [Giardia duodenalis]|uniref:Gp49 n=1 Tax=Giardia intestinalis TaxID=5741 RepID=V6TIN5_GIAIN|nr:Hypothetical protein DHA2_151221 [Giardia intestinalis]
MILVLALVLTLGRASSFPADMPTLRCGHGSCSSISEVYVSLLKIFTHHVDEFVHMLKTEVFSPELYHSLSAELETSTDQYALLFEELIPTASRVDYFLYNAFLNVVTDTIVSMASSATGTNLGYSLTVKDSVGSADRIYKFLRTTARHIVSDSFDAVSLPGLPGFLIARQAAYGYSVTTLHDQESGVPGSFSSEIVLHNTVKELALSLGSGFVLPQTSLAEYLFSNSIQLPSIYMTDFTYRYRYPFMIAFTGSSRYEGRVVFSNGTTHRTLTSATQKWHLVQTAQPYNVTHPLRSDFRITQLEGAQKTSLSQASDSFPDFYNTLRVFPFRTSLTPFLTAISGDGAHNKAVLQSCVSIKDAAKQTVACADPPPPTNWASVIFSLVMIAAVIFLWVYGIKNASYMAKLDEYRMKHPEKVILDPYEQRQSDRKTAHEALQKELERFATTRSVAE